MDEVEHEERRPRDPGPPTAAPPEPAAAAIKVHLILHIVSGSMAPLSDTSVNLHEFGKKTSIPMTKQGNDWVGEVSTRTPSLSLFVKRPSQPVPRVYDLLVRPDGKVDGNKDLLVRSRTAKTAAVTKPRRKSSFHASRISPAACR